LKTGQTLVDLARRSHHTAPLATATKIGKNGGAKPRQRSHIGHKPKEKE